MLPTNLEEWRIWRILGDAILSFLKSYGRRKRGFLRTTIDENHLYASNLGCVASQFLPPRTETGLIGDTGTIPTCYNRNWAKSVQTERSSRTFWSLEGTT